MYFVALRKSSCFMQLRSKGIHFAPNTDKIAFPVSAMEVKTFVIMMSPIKSHCRMKQIFIVSGVDIIMAIGSPLLSDGPMIGPIRCNPCTGSNRITVFPNPKQCNYSVPTLFCDEN